MCASAHLRRRPRRTDLVGRSWLLPYTAQRTTVTSISSSPPSRCRPSSTYLSEGSWGRGARARAAGARHPRTPADATWPAAARAHGAVLPAGAAPLTAVGGQAARHSRQRSSSARPALLGRHGAAAVAAPPPSQAQRPTSARGVPSWFRVRDQEPSRRSAALAEQGYLPCEKAARRVAAGLPFTAQPQS